MNGRGWIIFLAVVVEFVAICFTVADIVAVANRGEQVPLSDVGLLLGLLSLSFTNYIIAYQKCDKN